METRGYPGELKALPQVVAKGPQLGIHQPCLVELQQGSRSSQHHRGAASMRQGCLFACPESIAWGQQDKGKQTGCVLLWGWQGHGHFYRSSGHDICD